MFISGAAAAWLMRQLSALCTPLLDGRVKPGHGEGGGVVLWNAKRSMRSKSRLTT
jgi:hypothetical protein